MTCRLAAVELKTDVAAMGRETAQVDHDCVDRILEEALQSGGSIGRGRERDWREAGLLNPLRAIFSLGFQ